MIRALMNPWNSRKALKTAVYAENEKKNTRYITK